MNIRLLSLLIVMIECGESLPQMNASSHTSLPDNGDLIISLRDEWERPDLAAHVVHYSVINAVQRKQYDQLNSLVALLDRENELGHTVLQVLERLRDSRAMHTIRQRYSGAHLRDDFAVSYASTLAYNGGLPLEIVGELTQENSDLLAKAAIGAFDGGYPDVCAILATRSYNCWKSTERSRNTSSTTLATALAVSRLFEEAEEVMREYEAEGHNVDNLVVDLAVSYLDDGRPREASDIVLKYLSKPLTLTLAHSRIVERASRNQEWSTLQKYLAFIATDAARRPAHLDLAKDRLSLQVARSGKLSLALEIVGESAPELQRLELQWESAGLESQDRVSALWSKTITSITERFRPDGTVSNYAIDCCLNALPHLYRHGMSAEVEAAHSLLQKAGSNSKYSEVTLRSATVAAEYGDTFRADTLFRQMIETEAQGLFNYGDVILTISKSQRFTLLSELSERFSTADAMYAAFCSGYFDAAKPHFWARAIPSGAEKKLHSRAEKKALNRCRVLGRGFAEAGGDLSSLRYSVRFSISHH